MVVRVLGFVVAYALWFYLAYRLNKGSAKRPGGESFFRTVFVSSLLLGLAVATFPALHSGVFNFKIALAFFFVSQSSILLITIFRWFVELNKDTVMACSRWAGLFLGHTAKGFLWLVFLLVFLTLIAYPVIVVVTIIWAPSNPEMFAIKAASLTFGLVAIPLTAWLFASIVSHPFWRESIRGQLFLLFSSGFVNVFVFLVLSLWAFGLTGNGTTVSLLGVSTEFSPWLIGGLLAGMIAFYFVPYVRGVLWGSRTYKSHLDQRLGLVERVIANLKAPLPQNLLERLGQFHQELVALVKTFTQADPAFELATALENPNYKPRKLRIEREAFNLARPHDVRFEQADWLRTLTASIETTTADLAAKSDDEARRVAAEQWASFYQLEREKIRRSKESTSKSRAPVIILIAFLLSPIVSVFLSKCGQFLWEMLSRAVA